MAIFRVEKTKDFTLMSNHHLRNKALSLKAKGLLSLMLSLPDTWDYTLKGLASICSEGIDAIRTAVKELEQHGYIVRKQLRGENGRIRDMEYIIYERPQKNEQESAKPRSDSPELENPILDNPILDMPMLEEATQLNTKELNTQSIYRSKKGKRQEGRTFRQTANRKVVRRFRSGSNTTCWFRSMIREHFRI